MTVTVTARRSRRRAPGYYTTCKTLRLPAEYTVRPGARSESRIIGSYTDSSDSVGLLAPAIMASGILTPCYTTGMRIRVAVMMF